MAELYGSHFEYAGILSRKYGLIFCTAGTSRYTQISGKIEGVTIYHRAAKAAHLVGNDYSNSPVSFSVDIVTDDDSVISKEDRKEIERWLFNRSGYHKLYIDIDDDREGETYELVNGEQKRLYLNCRFLNARRLEYNGGIVGYNATMETDSGYWWQEPVSVTVEVPSGQASASTVITADTDIEDYVYPTVTVVMKNGGSGGYVKITNTSDDKKRVTKINGLPAGSRVKMNGEMNYIGMDIEGATFNIMEMYNRIDEMVRLTEKVNVLLDGNIDYTNELRNFTDCISNCAVGMTGYALADPQPASQEAIGAGTYYTLETEIITIPDYSDREIKVFRYVKTLTYTSGKIYFVNVSDGKTHSVFITRYSDPSDTSSEVKDDSGVVSYINELTESGSAQGVIDSDRAKNGLIIHVEEGRPDTGHWYDFLKKLYDMDDTIGNIRIVIERTTWVGFDLSDLLRFYDGVNLLLGRSETRIFPRLLNGENKIEIDGSSALGVESVTFEFQNRRML